ncbi:undecaprenyl-diphosphate phosphatase [bacterium]|nr:undecaprenyl-diphosphate phosphatase [bacterium]
MGSYFQLLVLGIVQGLTEFLPVSSSGHLVLAQNLTGFDPPGVLTEVSLHMATLIAVLAYFRRDLAALFLVRRETIALRGTYLFYLGLATTATLALIYPFRHLLEALTEGRTAMLALVATFTATAAVMFAIDALLRSPRARVSEVTRLGWLPTVVIGLTQGVAALPGISRSGTTIFMGVLLGLKREEAARFSFLLFIPAAVVAMAYELFQVGSGELAFPRELVGPLLLGCLAALASGIAAIHLLLMLLQRARLRWFGVYLLILAAFTLLRTL